MVEFKWVVKASHKKIYTDFVERHKHNDLVRDRIDRNIKHSDIKVSKPIFWRTLVGCLLTTQQRSGEGSLVSSFIEGDSDLFKVTHCLRNKKLKKYAEKILSDSRLRRSKKIAEEIDHAATFLKNNGWQLVKIELDKIASYTTVKKERYVARFLQDHFKGIGPKQSRNLIQWMGFSKYEIPLDSRLIKVLRGLDFPVPLSSKALSDEDYYCFIEDGIQLIMKKIDVYPCVFDACAFTSLEKGI